MNPISIYTGSSLVVVFKAKDNQGANLDISSYEKKVSVVAGNISKIYPEITPIDNSSFSIELSGDETKKLGSGTLNLVLELKKDKDERVGKACPLTLISPNSSNCSSGNLVMDSGNIDVDLKLENTSIGFDLIMGSTIINQGGETPSIDEDRIKKLLFIDIWNTICGNGQYGIYNTLTGFFELNGFTDIPYAEALQIYANTAGLKISDIANGYKPTYQVRTNLPLSFSYNGSMGWNFTNTFGFLAPFEVLNLCCLSRDQFGNVNSITTNTFQSPSLKRVIGRIMIVATSSTALTGTNTFLAPKLEQIELNLSGFKPTATASIAFGALEVLSLESLTYLVSTYSHTQVLTIKVHQNIYSKLTNGASYPEWANLVTIALAKNITFAL